LQNVLIVCETLEDLISKLGKHNNDVIKYEVKLRKHILHQKSYRNLYHTWRTEFVQSKEEFLCIIHDKMNHEKIALSRLQMCNKMIYGLGQLHVILTCMITHGNKDERYVQYSNKLWPNDPNFTIGFLLWLFCTLEITMVL
jgi:hypothetical protein